MWLSWRDVASGLPDDFAKDISIACTTSLRSCYYYSEMSAVGSRTLSKLIFASCLGYFDRAYYRVFLCDLINGIINIMAAVRSRSSSELIFASCV